MAFEVNPNDGIVPIDVANEWAKRWQQFVVPFNKERPVDNPYFPKAYLLHRKQIDAILNTPNAVNIRIYFGMDEKMNNHLMMVGVDKEGNDLLPTTSKTEGEGEGEVYNLALPCPPTCSRGGGLGG
jgi:hypothetical protein